MWRDMIRKKSCLQPGADCRRCSGAEMEKSVLAIFWRRPSHTQQAELPRPAIQSHQTIRDYSCIVDRFGADSIHVSHFFGSRCLSVSTDSNKSPCFSTRTSVWSERNFKSSARFFFKQFSTSFQVTGVETVGSSFARNE